MRRTFRLSGDISFLALELSSSKITSRHQCSWFSIDQWHRTAWAKRGSSVSEEMKYRVSVEVSLFLVTVVRTSPTDFRPLQSFCSGSQDRSVNKRYSRFSIRPWSFSSVLNRGISSRKLSKYRTTFSSSPGWFLFRAIT